MPRAGRHRVLGKAYPDDRRVDQGRAVARRPRAASGDRRATSPASSPATSSPTSHRRALVERLAKTFRDTDGDLKEMANALVARAGDVDHAARPSSQRPSEWIVAMVRAIGLRTPRARALCRGSRAARRADLAPARPQRLRRRRGVLDRRASASGSTSPTTSPSASPRGRTARVVLDEALGPLASADTRQTVARAESAPAGPRRLPSCPPSSSGGRSCRAAPRLLAPRAADRLPAPCLLGPTLPKLARADRPRSARARRRPARRPRRPCRRRPGRRSQLRSACAATSALLVSGEHAGPAPRQLLRPQSRHAQPAPALQGAAGDHRARHRHALSRALAFRRPGRARERPRRARLHVDTGWLNRALGADAARARVARQGRPRRRPVDGLSSCAASAPVLGWAPQSPGHASRGPGGAGDGSLRAARSGLEGGAGQGPRDRPRWRAQGMPRRCRNRRCRRAAARVRHAVPEARGAATLMARRRRPAHRRAGLRRLGHARQRRRRPAAASPSFWAGSTAPSPRWRRAWASAWKRDRGRRRHRVRPHRPHQRHRAAPTTAPARWRSWSAEP